MPGTKEFGDPGVCFQTRARCDGDHWVINGQKSSWVSNGIIATHALTFLTIYASKGMNGGGVAIIPLDLPGVSRGHPLDKLGQRALNQGEIVFDGVRIPQNYMIAQPDLYPIMMSATLALANAAIGTMFSGVAFEVAHDAVQLFGSYGLSKGYTIEKLFRDARSSLIADGCNEVLTLAAAQALLSSH